MAHGAAKLTRLASLDDRGQKPQAVARRRRCHCRLQPTPQRKSQLRSVSARIVHGSATERSRFPSERTGGSQSPRRLLARRTMVASRARPRPRQSRRGCHRLRGDAATRRLAQALAQAQVLALERASSASPPRLPRLRPQPSVLPRVAQAHQRPIAFQRRISSALAPPRSPPRCPPMMRRPPALTAESSGGQERVWLGRTQRLLCQWPPLGATTRAQPDR